jgi:DNA-binding MarR family transcriptional regulator
MQEEPDAPAPPQQDSLGYLVRDLHRSFDRLLSAQLGLHDVLSGQWSALRVLWDEDNLSQVQIAERMKIERASLTMLINGMEKKGLITRTQDPSDKRKLCVRLTPKGRAMKRHLLPIGDAVNARATQGLSKQEIKTIKDLIKRMTANFE